MISTFRKNAKGKNQPLAEEKKKVHAHFNISEKTEKRVPSPFAYGLQPSPKK
jgi:hypothetical protein